MKQHNFVPLRYILTKLGGNLSLPSCIRSGDLLLFAYGFGYFMQFTGIKVLETAFVVC